MLTDLPFSGSMTQPFQEPLTSGESIGTMHQVSSSSVSSTLSSSGVSWDSNELAEAIAHSLELGASLNCWSLSLRLRHTLWQLTSGLRDGTILGSRLISQAALIAAVSLATLTVSLRISRGLGVPSQAIATQLDLLEKLPFD